MICKHYKTPQGCSYGDKCQFAHGPQELKMFNPNSFSENPIDFSKNQKNIINYKIVKCKNWEKDGSCKYGKYCTFAHGDNDLRSKNENLYQIQPQIMYNPFIDPMMLQMQMMNNFDGNKMQNMNQIMNGQVDQNQLMMRMNLNGNNLNNFNGNDLDLNNLNMNNININNMNMNNMNNMNMNNMNNMNMNNMNMNNMNISNMNNMNINNMNMNNVNNFGLNNFEMNNLNENNLNGNKYNNEFGENLEGNENELNHEIEG